MLKVDSFYFKAKINQTLSSLQTFIRLDWSFHVSDNITRKWTSCRSNTVDFIENFLISFQHSFLQILSEILHHIFTFLIPVSGIPSSRFLKLVLDIQIYLSVTWITSRGRCWRILIISLYEIQDVLSSYLFMKNRQCIVINQWMCN